MPDQDIERLLATAVEEVLETMFFSESMGPCEPEPAGSGFEARVIFRGAMSGSVSVRISKATACNLAASFLGESEDSLDDAQVAQVVCELANMLCGSIVTRMESHGVFDLAAPELLTHAADQQTTPDTGIQRSFAIERGTLTLSLVSTQLPCSCRTA